MSEFLICERDTLTLVFDNPQAAFKFMVWFLEGGGEEDSNFDTVTWDVKKGYLRIAGTGFEEDEE